MTVLVLLDGRVDEFSIMPSCEKQLAELCPCETLRSSSDLTIEEMCIAITRFRNWAAEQGYYLPEAQPKDDGSMEFASGEDLDGFRQAKLETDRIGKFL